MLLVLGKFQKNYWCWVTNCHATAWVQS